MRMGVRSAALFSISVVGTLGREIAKAKNGRRIAADVPATPVKGPAADPTQK